MKRKEIWKNIPKYKGLYQASNYGKIKSLEKLRKGSGYDKIFYAVHKEKILIPGLNSKGYHVINLVNKGIHKSFTVHSIIGKLFVKGYKKGLEINHKKGIKTDNRAWMLEWVTHQRNCIHSIEIGLRKSFNEKQVYKYSKEGKLLNVYKSITNAANKTKNDRAGISRAVQGIQKTCGGFIWKDKK